jgi:hypothetical protein
MEFTLKDQIFNFFVFLFFGVILSIFLDLLKILEFAIIGRNKVTDHNIRDILFFVISSLFSYLLILALNNGEISAYIFFAEFFGHLVWRNTLSKKFVKFLEMIVQKFKNPILSIIKFLEKKAKSSSSFFKNKIKKVYKRVYKTKFNFSDFKNFFRKNQKSLNKNLNN